MPRDNPWSHTDAPPAREEGKLEDWHFDILGVNSDASDAQVRKAYKEVILRFHPDKTGNADVAKQLNEAKTKLLDQEKRAEYTREGREPVSEHEWSLPFTYANMLKPGDIVVIHGVENSLHYNHMHGRVMQCPERLESCKSGQSKYTIQLQHRRQQFDVDFVVGDERLKQLKLSGRKLTRLYGDKERDERNSLWSAYYQKGARVAIRDVQEAFWYNGMQAEVDGFNRDLARVEVLLHSPGRKPERLAFMPHNVSLVVHDATAALEEALRVEKAARASESARNDERAREAGEEKTRLHARILEIQALEPQLREAGEEKTRLHARIQALEQQLREASHAGQNERVDGSGGQPSEPPQPETSTFNPVQGDTVEVRWTADPGSRKRRTIWPVGRIDRVVRTEAGERRYDVRVPSKEILSKQSGGMLRDVRAEDIKRKRQRGRKTT